MSDAIIAAIMNDPNMAQGFKDGLVAKPLSSDQCVALLTAMMKQKPWKDRAWARMALACAARAIQRGRLLTEEEKFDTLMRAMAEEEAERHAGTEAATQPSEG